jgi:hypothetical protein
VGKYLHLHIIDCRPADWNTLVDRKNKASAFIVKGDVSKGFLIEDHLAGSV